MASKGQKFKKYDKEFKKKILDEYFSGESSYTIIANKYDIPLNTVKMWVDQTRYPERYRGLGKKRGRPKGSTTDWREKYEILKKYQAFLKAQRERK